MRVPILKQGDYLIASIQSALSGQDLMQLRDDEQVVATDGRRHRAFGCGRKITIDAAVALALKENQRVQSAALTNPRIAGVASLVCFSDWLHLGFSKVAAVAGRSTRGRPVFSTPLWGPPSPR